MTFSDRTQTDFNQLIQLLSKTAVGFRKYAEKSHGLPKAKELCNDSANILESIVEIGNGLNENSSRKDYEVFMQNLDKALRGKLLFNYAKFDSSDINEVGFGTGLWDSMPRIESMADDLIREMKREIITNQLEPELEKRSIRPIDHPDVNEQYKIISKQIEELGDFDKDNTQETQERRVLHKQELGRKQEAKDVSQKPEDLMAREDAKKDEKKPTVNEQAKESEKRNALIDQLTGALEYDAEQPDAMDKMWSVLKDASKKGMLSEEMKQEYRNVIKWAKEEHASKSDAVEKLAEVLTAQRDKLADKDPFLQFAQSERDALFPKKKTEKTQQNKDVLQKPADLRAPEDVKKDEKRQAVADFKSGAEKVLDLDKQIEQDKQKKLNQAALAAHRRKILLNRGNGNV